MIAADFFADTAPQVDGEELIVHGDRLVRCWTDGHVRGTDVFELRDGPVAAKHSYFTG